MGMPRAQQARRQLLDRSCSYLLAGAQLLMNPSVEPVLERVEVERNTRLDKLSIRKFQVTNCHALPLLAVLTVQEDGVLVVPVRSSEALSPPSVNSQLFLALNLDGQPKGVRQVVTADSALVLVALHGTTRSFYLFGREFQDSHGVLNDAVQNVTDFTFATGTLCTDVDTHY